MVLPDTKREGGFTLLEVLIAMIVLAVGGVSIISLFAAAVSLQYDSVIDQRRALILTDVLAEAQQVLDAHTPRPEQIAPKPVERKKVERFPDFEYEIAFSGSGVIPKGEGAVAVIQLYYRGRALEEVTRRVLQRTVFTDAERKELRSVEMDRKADQAAEAEKDD